MRPYNVRNSSMSLSFTLTKIEKVEQNIIKMTHKLIILRFWVKGDINPLYGSDSCFIVIRSPQFFPFIYQKV